MVLYTGFCLKKQSIVSNVPSLAIAALIASVLLYGCTATIPCASVTQLNAALAGEEAAVFLKNGNSYEANGIRVLKDSTRFLDADGRSPRCIQTGEIAYFQTTSRFGGAVVGMFGGTICGAGLFYGIGALAIDPRSDFADLRVDIMLLSGVVIGGATGLIYGIAHGNRTRYELTADTTGVH